MKLNLGEMVDFTAPESVEIKIRNDGKVIWVNVDGVCALRCCRIGDLQLDDERQQARKTSESSSRTDVPEKVPSLTPSVEQAGSKSVIDFPGRMYAADWVSQEND